MTRTLMHDGGFWQLYLNAPDEPKTETNGQIHLPTRKGLTDARQERNERVAAALKRVLGTVRLNPKTGKASIVGAPASDSSANRTTARDALRKAAQQFVPRAARP